MINKNVSIKANEGIKELLKDYSDSFRIYKQRAREEQLLKLPVGATVVPKDVELYGEYKDRFNDKVTEIKYKVKDIIDPIREDLVNQTTDAPDTDAINMVSLLTTRKNVSEDDIYNMLDRYGNNYQVYNAVKDIAIEHEIRVPDHPIDRELENIDNLLANCNQLSLKGAENGHASAGFMSLMGMSVDDAFPIDQE